MRQLILEEGRNLIIHISPGIHRQVVTLVLGDQTLVELLGNQGRLGVALSHELSDLVKVHVVGHTS